MGLISLPKTWSPNEILTAGDLNNEFTAITAQVNGSIESANIGTLTSTLTFNSSTNADIMDVTKSGVGAGSVMDVSDAGTSPTLDLQKTGAGAVILCNQDANAVTLDVDSDATTANVFDVTAAITTGNVFDLNLAAMTTGNVFDVSAAVLTTGTVLSAVNLNALTTGCGINVTSDSADVSARNLIYVKNDNVAASGTTCVYVKQDSTGLAIDAEGLVKVASSATASEVLNVSAASLTTGTAVIADDLDSLTTGCGLNVTSNSADVSARNLVYVKNDNAAAVGTVGIYVKQDSTGDSVRLVGGTFTIGS